MLIGRAKASLFSANGRFEHWEAADSIRGLGEVLTGGSISGADDAREISSRGQRTGRQGNVLVTLRSRKYLKQEEKKARFP